MCHFLVSVSGGSACVARLRLRKHSTLITRLTCHTWTDGTVRWRSAARTGGKYPSTFNITVEDNVKCDRGVSLKAPRARAAPAAVRQGPRSSPGFGVVFGSASFYVASAVSGVQFEISAFAV